MEMIDLGVGWPVRVAGWRWSTLRKTRPAKVAEEELRKEGGGGREEGGERGERREN